MADCISSGIRGNPSFLLAAVIVVRLFSPCEAEEIANFLRELKTKTADQETVRRLGGRDQFRIYEKNPVLSPGSNGAWDAGAIGSVTVVRAGEMLHMFYEAWAGNGDQPGLDFNSLQIGHAVSYDGIHWLKDPANPVLAAGDPQDWDADGTWDPYVVFENGVFKMWYGGGIHDHCEWGYAESRDGTHFVKQGQISHGGSVSDDHVIHFSQDEPYYMYYWDKKFEPRQSLFRAQSSDEKHFDFAGAQRILIKGEPEDAMQKFTQVFVEQGTWYMLYANFVRPQCADSTTRLARSDDGLHWTSVNKNLFAGHDAEIVSVDDTLHLAYFSQRGFYNQPNGDVRLAVYAGRISDLIDEDLIGRETTDK